tara:strand:+ start:4710 stop:5420 length:711 start_codon:yes stop_codon:yes gene_type:complete
MKKLVAALMLTIGLHSTYAEDAVTSTPLTLEAGYVDTLYINGVPRVSEAPFVGGTFVKPNALPLGLDLTGGALLAMPEEDNSESHWNLGVGKTLGFENFGLRVGAELWRHQSGVSNIPDSTEVAAKVGLVNPVLSPYVKLVNDFELEQKGYAIGVETDWSLWGLGVSPTLSWNQFDDYESIVASATLTYETDFLGGLTPFGTVNWVDNDFDANNFNFASYEANGEWSWLAGLRYKF